MKTPDSVGMPRTVAAKPPIPVAPKPVPAATIYPLAIQHILSINETEHGMLDHRGLVIHIMDGTLSGTDAWFHNLKAKASSHLGLGKLGNFIQWVHFDDKAWTEASGNPYWISVECEGRGGDSLTPAQIASLAKLYHWLESQYHFGFELANNPNDKGLGHHSMGGKLWGNHLMCPGVKIIAQKPLILAQAKAIK